MKTSIHNLFFLFLILAAFSMQSCQKAEGNSTGSEFMPDMAHSTAYEANVYSYYYNNTWGSEEDYYKRAMPRKPVKGTIPRGQAFMTSTNGDMNEALRTMAMAKGIVDGSGISTPMNGAVPYYYANTEEGRSKAMSELINNPYPISTSGLEKGKALYDIYCGICHGEKGDGAGYLVRDDGGMYPAQPANFLLEEHLQASNGRYYHAIMHGRNLMGSYADKMTYEERWQVIHYIRSLQAKELKLAYNQTQNTLNSTDRPAGEAGPMSVNSFAASKKMVEKDVMHNDGHADDHGHHDESHDHDHNHDNSNHSHEHGHDHQNHDHDHGGH